MHWNDTINCAWHPLGTSFEDPFDGPAYAQAAAQRDKTSPVARAQKHARSVLLAACMALSGPAHAALCDLEPVAAPADFPNQPINILIPRSQSSGALRLGTELVANMPSIPNPSGPAAPPEVNLLFKSDGNLTAALDFFARLPANGYNVIQLNDTYASYLAAQDIAHAPLVPIAVAQITFSQVYIRTDDPRFSDLESFAATARDPDSPPLVIANFQTRDGSVGLEDFLIDGFVDAYDLRIKPPQSVTGSQATRRAAPRDIPALEVQGYENGSERYFSLFTQVRPGTPQSDALIEQPGDIARLLEEGMLKPIFTLLPEAGITQAFVHPLGPTAAFETTTAPKCAAFYRYRGFFVSEAVPKEHRDYLAWLFQSAFSTEAFQAFNASQYMDVLYDDPAVSETYCSSERAAAVFEQRVQNYRNCQATQAEQ